MKDCQSHNWSGASPLFLMPFEIINLCAEFRMLYEAQCAEINVGACTFNSDNNLAAKYWLLHWELENGCNFAKERSLAH